MIVHCFTLATSVGPSAAVSAGAFDRLAADPPTGCVFEPQLYPGVPGLRCEREAPTRFEAISEVVGEVRIRHGVLLDDLGIEKLAEWSDDRPDDPDQSGELGNTWGRDIAAQALLLGIERFLRLGYDVTDVRSFVDRALGSPHDH
ncbi:hypothetical protein [Kitasatospora sp. NPDC050463]|uniref:hypothetical protein n=1 Tax=Kitasatospora sp. NPDC050463 TaxID=3155786 RepID=UPI0033C7F05B